MGEVVNQPADGVLNADGSGAAKDESPDKSDSDNQKTPDDSTKVVPWNNHRRALDDMHKFKKRNVELETKLGEIEDQRLREKEDYKSLAEKYKADAVKYKAEAEQTTSAFVDTQKFSEVKSIALANGLRAEAVNDLDLLKLDAVELETTSSGRFNVSGAKDFVENLKRDKPHWFVDNVPPKINPGGGGAPPDTTGKITPSQLLQAEKAVKFGKLSEEKYLRLYKTYLAQQQSKT